MTSPVLSRNQGSLKTAYAAAAVAVLIWGGTPAATKVAVLDFDPLMAALLRTVLAGAIALPVVWLARYPLPTTKGDWWLLVLSVVAGFFGFTILFSYGVQQTSATHAALINAIIPVFTGFFGVLLEKKKPSGWWYGGAVLSLAGLIVLISGRGSGGAATVLGDLLCLASSAAAGFGYVVGAILSRKIGAGAVTFWGLVLASALQLPLLIVLGGGDDWQSIGSDSWLGVMYLAVGASILAYMAWYKALAIGGSVRMGTVQFAMPVISLFLAVILFEEVLTVISMIATVMIVAGIILSKKT